MKPHARNFHSWKVLYNINTYVLGPDNINILLQYIQIGVSILTISFVGRLKEIYPLKPISIINTRQYC